MPHSRQVPGSAFGFLVRRFLRSLLTGRGRFQSVSHVRGMGKRAGAGGDPRSITSYGGMRPVTGRAGSDGKDHAGTETALYEGIEGKGVP